MSTQIRPSSTSTPTAPPATEAGDLSQPLNVPVNGHTVTLPAVPNAPLQPHSNTATAPRSFVHHDASADAATNVIQSEQVKDATPHVIDAVAVEEEDQTESFLKDVGSRKNSEELSSENIPVAVAVPYNEQAASKKEMQPAEAAVERQPATNPAFRESSDSSSRVTAPPETISAPRTASGDLQAAREKKLNDAVELWMQKYTTSYAAATKLVQKNSSNSDAIAYYETAGKLFKEAANALKASKDQPSMDIVHCLYHEAECQLQMAMFAEKAPKPIPGLPATSKPFDQREIFKVYQKIAEGFQLARQNLSKNVPERKKLIELLEEYKNVLDRNANEFSSDVHVHSYPQYRSLEGYSMKLINASDRFKNAIKPATKKDDSCVVM